MTRRSSPTADSTITTDRSKLRLRLIKRRRGNPRHDAPTERGQIIIPDLGNDGGEIADTVRPGLDSGRSDARCSRAEGLQLDAAADGWIGRQDQFPRLIDQEKIKPKLVCGLGKQGLSPGEIDVQTDDTIHGAIGSNDRCGKIDETEWIGLRPAEKIVQQDASCTSPAKLPERPRWNQGRDDTSAPKSKSSDAMRT